MGVHYVQVQRKRPLDLADPGDLPAAIRLIDGRIECVTCHDPTSPEPRKLTIEARAGALCLACHRM